MIWYLTQISCISLHKGPIGNVLTYLNWKMASIKAKSYRNQVLNSTQ